MLYIINEGKENKIISTEITVEDFLYLKENNDFILKKLMCNDKIIKNIHLPNIIIDKIVEAIINEKDINELHTILVEFNIPLFSLLPVSTYRNKYEELKKFRNSKHIIINCNKNNIIRALELSKKINKSVLIDGRSISLKEYNELLSNYNLDSLDDIDIKINYQEQNSPINVKELYNLSKKVNEISKKIEKYNLSPLEKIIYVYDIVKEREYKKEIECKDSSRDLDKVLEGNSIVCVGYSNLFNSILKNLNINAMPLVSNTQKHQRSIVYINDKKYNIDGVYVFDPTWDRKVKDSYINNYTYFGITLNNSKQDMLSNTYKKLNTSFDNILKIYYHNNASVKREEKILTEEIFKFINSKDYEEFEDKIETYKFVSQEERYIIREIYENNILKYNPNEIDEVVFFNALYNVRIVEYYEGIVDSIEIDDIIECTVDKSISQSINYNTYENKEERFIYSLDKDMKVRDNLDREVSDNQNKIKRKELNIKLLKLLRNK